MGTSSNYLSALKRVELQLYRDSWPEFRARLEEWEKVDRESLARADRFTARVRRDLQREGGLDINNHIDRALQLDFHIRGKDGTPRRKASAADIERLLNELKSGPGSAAVPAANGKAGAHTSPTPAHDSAGGDAGAPQSGPIAAMQSAITAAVQTGRVRDIYFNIRRTIWNAPEFGTLAPGARRILEIVIDLAREEAFPWYLRVQAQEVRRLARLSEQKYTLRIHELESFALTRAARIIRLDDGGTSAAWPGTVNAKEPARDLPQWIIRYKRGIPWNKRAAAWWINYDLLCQTGRVLPCFIVSTMTLGKHYFDRRRRFGGKNGITRGSSELSDDPADTPEGWFSRLEAKWALKGPRPPAGLRCALWEGQD